MSENNALTRAHLKTPKAAAIAGIAFSTLLITILWLLRRSIPADPLDTGEWLATESRTVALALNLVPFAGIAFLWFIGVLRDRLGQQEDRFFGLSSWWPLPLNQTSSSTPVLSASRVLPPISLQMFTRSKWLAYL
jgi:hypothetical protein